MKNESEISQIVRLLAADNGVLLTRNNVGAGQLANGRHIRWGLFNESHAQNMQIKSSDLIGIRRRVITPDDIGTVIGQFVAREIKREGWKYHGSPHEQAQQRFIDLVNQWGGDAAFSTGEL